jgi:hypothetical protein
MNRNASTAVAQRWISVSMLHRRWVAQKLEQEGDVGQDGVAKDQPFGFRIHARPPLQHRLMMGALATAGRLP